MDRLVGNTEKKGRDCHWLRGSKHPRTHLTESDVLAIREAFLDGESTADIAIRYGLTRKGVDSIVRGETWTHV